MTTLRGLYFFLTVLMIISSVKGRWLETSDGVHDINDMNQKNDSFLRMSVSDSNPTTLHASGKRCKSIYGFLPCADTVPEGIFLILMYTYALMLGEECLKKGSAALLIHFRKKDIAGSVFRVLMALPRVFMVIVVSETTVKRSWKKKKTERVGVESERVEESLQIGSKKSVSDRDFSFKKNRKNKVVDFWEGNRLKRLLVCDKQQQEKRCREADQEDPEFFVRDWWDGKEKKNTSGS